MAPHIPEIQHGAIGIKCSGGNVLLDDTLGMADWKNVAPWGKRLWGQLISHAKTNWLEQKAAAARESGALFCREPAQTGDIGPYMSPLCGK